MSLKRLAQPRYAAYFLILIVSLINVMSYTDFGHHANLRAWGDATYYIKMSQQTFAHVPNPFAFRLLSPLIVHEMQKVPGLGLNSSWLLLTLGATYLALVVFFKLLHDRLRLSVFISTAFTVMLACTYSYTLFNYSDIWIVDPLNNLFFVLALYFIFLRRLGAFIAVVVLGSINKETTLMLAPLYPLLAVIRTRRLASREAIVSAAAVAGVLVFYVFYHLWVLAMLGPSSHVFLSRGNQASTLETIRFALSSHKVVEQQVIYGVFQFLWFTYAYGLYRLYKSFGWRSEWLIAGIYVFIVALLGRLFATDTERVYVMIAPMVLGISSMIFDGFKSEQQRLWVGLVVLLYLALNFHWLAGDAPVLANITAIIVFIFALKPDRLDFRRLLRGDAEAPQR